MTNLWIYQPNDYIRVTCTDGQIIEGTVTDVQDEEESGFGEEAINILTSEKMWIGVGKSEIRNIETLEQ